MSNSLEGKCTGETKWIADQLLPKTIFWYSSALVMQFIFIFFWQKIYYHRQGIDYGSWALQQLKADFLQQVATPCHQWLITNYAYAIYNTQIIYLFIVKLM